MSVRFIFGRSGSGKTHYCLEAIREALRTGPSGQQLILLVPQQATFQMEQTLLSAKGLEGYHRVRVTNFNRLAQEVLLETAGVLLPGLSETSKQMILWQLLLKHREALKVLSRSEPSEGFVAKLSSLISECSYYDKRPEDLFEQANKLKEGNDLAQKQLSEKLEDMGVLFRAYQEAIAGRFSDPGDVLDVMISQGGLADILGGAALWIDGFSGFTLQQLRALQAMCGCALRAEMTLCLDPFGESFRKVHREGASHDEVDATDLFHPTLVTYSRLRVLFEQVDIAIEEPLLLPADASGENPLPRYQGSEQLGLLERRLFDRGTTNTDNRGHESGGDDEIPVRGVCVVEAVNRRLEVEATAQHILRLCRDEGYRFRDIAVILRDFSDYQPLLEATFADYGIACFIDQRRSMRHHRLVELLRSGLGVLVNDFRNEDVFDYLKTELGPLDQAQTERLENYVLAHGIRADRWPGEKRWEDSDTEDIDALRRSAIEAILGFRDRLANEPNGEKDRYHLRWICTCLFGFLEELKVGDKLSLWTGQAEQLGEPDQAETHRQIYSAVIDLLEEMVEALGEVVVELEEFGSLLNLALGKLSLGMVPPSLDQVLIGTIERSRHPRIRAAFVLGVNEGRFPQVQLEDSLFSDAQRQQLAADGFELASSSVERLLDEQYLAYIALTRAQDFMWVSFAGADAKGDELKPSGLIDRIQQAVGNPARVAIASSRQSRMEQITNVSQLGQQLAFALSDENTDLPNRSQWQQLGRYGLGRADWSQSVRRSLGGLIYHNEASLDGDIADQLFGKELTGSITQLETFSACPFQRFGRYVLKIEPRKELKLARVDMGSFYHEAVCGIFSQMQGEGLTWGELTDKKIERFVTEQTEKLLRTEARYAGLRTASSRNHHVFERACKQLLVFCRSLRASAKAGHFVQQEAEVKFGPGQKLTGLELSLNHGRTLRLRGVIDRFDTAKNADGTVGVSVVDYKSRGKTFNYQQFYYGLSLQLMSYLLVLLRHLNDESDSRIEPAAMTYWPIIPAGANKTNDQVNEEDYDKLHDEDAEIEIKAKGLFNANWLEQLDHEVARGNGSKYFGFRINKDGKAGSGIGRAVIGSNELKDMLDFGQAKLIELAEGISAGDVAVSPYRSGSQCPCDYCDYKSLCRFDVRTDSYRELKSLSAKEVLTRISESNRDE
ncbi:MAG: exodeoxyribonuclease V subunit gamma [Planctomycetes bacterium]|nr:exodeoxyribonuclease V subunit gamma [Planctomycetota bacterium]